MTYSISEIDTADGVELTDKDLQEIQARRDESKPT